MYQPTLDRVSVKISQLWTDCRLRCQSSIDQELIEISTKGQSMGIGCHDRKSFGHLAYQLPLSDILEVHVIYSNLKLNIQCTSLFPHSKFTFTMDGWHQLTNFSDLIYL